MPKKKIKLARIAQLAGVSVATVDRVVHGRPGVKPHTIKHIQSIIKQLDNEGEPQQASSATAREKKITVLLPAGTNTFYDTLESKIIAAKNKYGAAIDLDVKRTEGFDPGALSAEIRKCAKYSDGIAIVAMEDPGVRETVNNVTSDGIPVLTLISDLSNSRRKAYIGIDNRAAGRTAGYLMGKLTQRSRGEVMLIAGSMSLSDHEDREIGFRRIIGEQFSHIKLLSYLEDRDDYRLPVYHQTRKVIQQHPDLIGIYNIGAGNRGIGQALEESSKASDITFIGHELSGYTRQFLIDGVMDAVLDQNPEHQAEQLILKMKQFAAGQRRNRGPAAAR